MVTQTHFNLNNLEAPLVSTSSVIGKEYLMDVGIDALARSIKSSPLDADIIENCSISLLNKQLNLLPCTSKNNRDIYENDMSKTITGILHAVSCYHDIVFIDTNSGRNDLTIKILENADLIVVNLSQNRIMLDDYAMNYKFDNKKIFYLIGNYNSNSKYNLKNIQKSYQWMKNKNTAVIPYNTEYMDAQSDGQVIQFMMKNMDCEKNESNTYFIREIKTAVTKIMKYAGLERQEKNGLYR
jgi:cellulose biosynthesis protein BcsQ